LHILGAKLASYIAHNSASMIALQRSPVRLQPSNQSNINNLAQRPFSNKPRKKICSAIHCQVEIKGAGASGYAVEGNRPTSPRVSPVFYTFPADGVFTATNSVRIIFSTIYV